MLLVVFVLVVLLVLSVLPVSYIFLVHSGSTLSSAPCINVLLMLSVFKIVPLLSVFTCACCFYHETNTKTLFSTDSQACYQTQ